MIQEDTISAVTTAPGNAAIGIVRISGADALQIADKIFLPHPGKNWKPILPIRWSMGLSGTEREEI